jgi:hypothetical protein
VTKFARTLLAVTFALLLSVGIVGKACPTYAQDADENDQSAGAWSAPDAGSADVSDHRVKVKPLDIEGCWSGNVTDSGDGSGTATFVFHQNSNLKKLANGSTFNFQWPDSAFAHGPVTGSVSTTGFKFTSKVAGQGEVCPVSGSVAGDDSALTGTVALGGSCAAIFQDVTFSIVPGCM